MGWDPKNPHTLVWWNDVEREPGLKRASWAARGFWCYGLWPQLERAQPRRGVLRGTRQELAHLSGASTAEFNRFLAALASCHPPVCDVIENEDETLTVVCRRTVREEKQRMGATERKRRERAKGQAETPQEDDGHGSGHGGCHAPGHGACHAGCHAASHGGGHGPVTAPSFPSSPLPLIPKTSLNSSSPELPSSDPPPRSNGWSPTIRQRAEALLPPSLLETILGLTNLFPLPPPERFAEWLEEFTTVPLTSELTKLNARATPEPGATPAQAEARILTWMQRYREHEEEKRVGKREINNLAGRVGAAIAMPRS